MEIISETLDIMPEKEIEDELFKVRGQISGDTLAQLHIRGANTNVNDALRRNGWNGEALVAVPVVTTEQRTGKVLGSRWEIRGCLAKYSLKASSVWGEALKTISLHLDLKADDFKFSARKSGIFISSMING